MPKEKSSSHLLRKNRMKAILNRLIALLDTTDVPRHWTIAVTKKDAAEIAGQLADYRDLIENVIRVKDEYP